MVETPNVVTYPANAVTTPTANSEPEPPNSELSSWFIPRRVALLLLALLVFAFPKIWAGTESFFRSDYGVMGYPAVHYLRESLRAGELPFWNPLSNCGAPFLAQWGTMCLYPGSLFLAALPLPWALGTFCLLHLGLGGLGMCFLARRWTEDRFAATVAAVTFTFNGIALGCITWPNYCVALGWMPWIVLLTQQAWREGGRKLVLAALAGTMQMLVGVPELVVLTWGLLGVMLLAEWVQSPKSKVQSQSAHEHTEPLRAPTTTASLAPTGGEGRGEGASHSQPVAHKSPPPSPLITIHYSLFTRFLLVIALIAALSAAQLLPFFDLLAHSQRDASFRDVRWPMPPWGWANFLVPLFHYAASPQGFWFQQQQHFLSSYHLGLGVLALALVAVWKARERRVWLLAGATFFALVMALGDAGFLYTALQKVLPGGGIARFPVKFVLLAGFTVPLLAAFGVAWLLRGNSRRLEAPSENAECEMRNAESSQSLLTSAATGTGSNRSSALLAVGGALVLGVVIVLWIGQQSPLPYDRWPETRSNAWQRVAFLLGALATLAVALCWRGFTARVRIAAGCSALALMAGDARLHLQNQTPGVPTQHHAFAHNAPLSLGLRHARIMIDPDGEQKLLLSSIPDWTQDLEVKSMTQWSHLNLVKGVRKVNGSSTLQLREQAEVQQRLYPALAGDAPKATGLKDFLGVMFVLHPDAIPLEGPRSSKREPLLAGVPPEFAPPDIVLDRIVAVEFDPRRVVYLPPEARGLMPTNAANVRVDTQRFTAQEIVAEVETDAPTILTVAQSFYHPWKAFVDGQPVKLWRANHAFQALAVPAGKHTVRLAYVDGRFRLGCGISLAGLAICGVLWWRSGRVVNQDQ